MLTLNNFCKVEQILVEVPVELWSPEDDWLSIFPVVNWYFDFHPASTAGKSENEWNELVAALCFDARSVKWTANPLDFKDKVFLFSHAMTVYRIAFVLMI